MAGGRQEENHIESLLHETDFFFFFFFREVKLANALSELESSGHKTAQAGLQAGPLLAEDRVVSGSHRVNWEGRLLSHLLSTKKRSG